MFGALAPVLGAIAGRAAGGAIATRMGAGALGTVAGRMAGGYMGASMGRNAAMQQGRRDGQQGY